MGYRRPIRLDTGPRTRPRRGRTVVSADRKPLVFRAVVKFDKRPEVAPFRVGMGADLAAAPGVEPQGSPLPASSGFPFGPQTAVNCRHFEDEPGKGRGCESLQPILKRPAFAGLFRWGSRLVRLHPVGLILDSRPADRRRIQGKRGVCRPIVARPNRSPSAGPQKVERSACCGRQQALPANGTFLRT